MTCIYNIIKKLPLRKGFFGCVLTHMESTHLESQTAGSFRQLLLELIDFGAVFLFKVLLAQPMQGVVWRPSLNAHDSRLLTRMEQET